MYFCHPKRDKRECLTPWKKFFENISSKGCRYEKCLYFCSPKQQNEILNCEQGDYQKKSSLNY